MIGMTFGRLTITGITSDGRRSVFEVKCKCGAVKNVRRSHLVAGRTKSCGCLKPESIRAAHTTHGMTHSPIYAVWAAMVNRATKNHPNYAGRGIGICKEWLKFASFYADMGSGWRQGLSIERINNSIGYFPDNCRWATRNEQAQNTRKSLTVLLAGERINLTEACRRYGAIYTTMRHRIFKQGMDPDKAFGLAYNRTRSYRHSKAY